jgi:hypothetical protein
MAMYELLSTAVASPGSGKKSAVRATGAPVKNHKKQNFQPPTTHHPPLTTNHSPLTFYFAIFVGH